MSQVSRSTGNAAKLAEQIRRFPVRRRGELEAFAAISERLAQLAHAHPVLFFVLATRHGPIRARRRAVHLAVSGRPLAEVAQAVGLPNCFRRLPPEACYMPFEPLHWSPAADRMLGPYIPSKPPFKAMAWLRIANYACRACDETFAAWTVREALALGKSFLIPAMLPVALYAWHSQQPDLPTGLVVAKKWTPRLSARTALSCTQLWLRRLRATAGMPDEGIRDPWLAAGIAGGYTFTPLLTHSQLIDEAEQMENCVDTYGDLLACNICRLFSVTRAGERLATLELRWSSAVGGLAINELKGPQNAECPASVRKAAEKWLALPHNRLSHAPRRACLRTLDEILVHYRKATSHGEPHWATGLTVPQLQQTIRIAVTQARQAACRDRDASRRRRETPGDA